MSALLPLTELQKQKARAQRVRIGRATVQRRNDIVANAERVARELGAKSPRQTATWLTVKLLKRHRDWAAMALGITRNSINNNITRCAPRDRVLARQVLARLESEFPVVPWWRKD